MMRIVIDEPRFRRLVAGEVVRFKTAGDKIEVECMLSDIGWPRILRAVLDGIAPEPGPRGPPDPPQAVEFLPLSQQPGGKRRR
jgi:hypothetical protein